MKLSYKYGVFYTDGGERTHEGVSSAGSGIHGYVFNELPSARYAGVPTLITPRGYEPKLTGNQIKDEKYNPVYRNWDLELKVKDSGVLKDGFDIKLVDGIAAAPGKTSQVGELMALVELLTNPALDIEHILVHSDSNYLVQGINRDLPNWKARGWCKADNTPIANLEIWQRIDELVATYGEKFEIVKIKAHDGFLGNELADRNATYAQVFGCNGVEEVRWLYTELNDSDYWEPEKPIPPLLHQKWCYSMTGVARETSLIDDEEFHHYLMGDHNKNKDDVELLCRAMSDVGLTYVLHRSRPPLLDSILDYHNDVMWKGVHRMYQSSVVSMINVMNVMKPKVLWELKRVGPVGLWMKNHRNDLESIHDDLVSKVLRPPRRSFAIVEEGEVLRDVIYAYVAEQGKTVNGQTNPSPIKLAVTDVTDKFYEELKNGNLKMTSFYEQTTKSLSLTVNNPCTPEPVKLILVRGIDLPSRNQMAKLVDKRPKVSVVAWPISKIAFRYGVLIECDDGYGFWGTPSDTFRVLANEEFKGHVEL